MDRLLSLLNSLHPEHDYLKADDLVAEGLLDSLDIVTLVPLLEAEFGITVAGADVNPDNFRNLATLNAFISRCARTRAHAA